MVGSQPELNESLSHGYTTRPRLGGRKHILKTRYLQQSSEVGLVSQRPIRGTTHSRPSGRKVKRSRQGKEAGPPPRCSGFVAYEPAQDSQKSPGGSPELGPSGLAPDYRKGGRTRVTEARQEETAPRSNVTAPALPSFPIPLECEAAQPPASSGCSLSPHFSPWRPRPPALGVAAPPPWRPWRPRAPAAPRPLRPCRVL